VNWEVVQPNRRDNTARKDSQRNEASRAGSKGGRRWEGKGEDEEKYTLRKELTKL
jgi:hypothetical protein